MPAHKLNQRQLQAQERRSEILTAAKMLFAQNGYHATTTRSINREVGMADGLLHHYFPEGKMQILETLVQEELDRKRKSLLERMQSINPDISLEEFLVIVGRVILEAATREPEMMAISLREYNLIKDKFSEPVLELSGLYQHVAKYLQVYVDRGEIRAVDPAFMAVQFISPFSLYVMTRTLIGESKAPYLSMDEETFLEQIVSCTLNTWQAP